MLKYLKKINPFKEPNYDHLSDKELTALWRKSIDDLGQYQRITTPILIVITVLNILLIILRIYR